MAGLVTTIQLQRPVILGDHSITEVSLREPVAREFVAIGPIEMRHRRAGLMVTLDLPGRAAAYLGICILDLAPALIRDLLDRASLADGLRLKAALAAFFFDVGRDDVESYAAVLAFDWRLMSLAEADDLPMSSLAHHCKRLSDHCRRRDRTAKQKGASRG